MVKPCARCKGSGAGKTFLDSCPECVGTGKAAIRCAQCWKWKKPTEFIGRRGVLIKRCRRCQDTYSGWDKKTPEQRAAVDSRASFPSDGPLRVSFVRESGNRKTGPIPVSMTSARTCPKSCMFYGDGCYAEQHILGMHWKRLSRGIGLTWPEFCEQVATLPAGQLWRHNEAGDLPGDDADIDARKLRELIVANLTRRGFTYTHKPLTRRNLRLMREANAAGFTINVSADSASDADRAVALGLPTTLVIPDYSTKLRTPKGAVIVTCPAALHEGVTCSTCELCYVAGRKSVVGFPAHGQRSQLIALRLRQLPLAV